MRQKEIEVETEKITIEIICDMCLEACYDAVWALEITDVLRGGEVKSLVIDFEAHKKVHQDFHGDCVDE